jgi:hypothetical protein
MRAVVYVPDPESSLAQELQRGTAIVAGHAWRDGFQPISYEQPEGSSALSYADRIEVALGRLRARSGEGQMVVADCDIVPAAIFDNVSGHVSVGPDETPLLGWWLGHGVLDPAELITTARVLNALRRQPEPRHAAPHAPMHRRTAS